MKFDTSSLTPASDIADPTRALVIKFAPVGSHTYRYEVSDKTQLDMRDILNAQRGAVLTRLSAMLAGLLPAGFVVKQSHSSQLELEPVSVPGSERWADRVTIELGIHDQNGYSSTKHYLAFTLRRGGARYRSTKFVRKVAVNDFEVWTCKLDPVLEAIRDEAVREANYSVERAAGRKVAASAAEVRRQQAVAALPEALRAQMTDRYGPNTPYIDDIKLTSDGYFVLDERQLVIKPELVAEFVDLLRRNNAK